jgi:uncharacterized protein with HEPN domain
MRTKTPNLLADILDAGGFILDCTRGKTLEDYQHDRQIRQAVERNFEVIGEAVNRLARIDPSVADRISDTSRIIAFRNVLIHGYDLIDDKDVWQVITGSFPKLIAETQALLPTSE